MLLRSNSIFTHIWRSTMNGVSNERYKLVKNEARKVICDAKAKLYKEIYKKLENNKVEKDLCIIT